MVLNFYYICLWISLAAGVFFVANLPELSRQKYDRLLFWVFSMIMVAFAAFRTLGIGLDDHNYSFTQFNKVCPTLTCGEILPSRVGRDQIWFALVGLLKSFAPVPQVVLWLSGFALFLKLLVMDRLCQHRSISLLFYSACFYVIHDITALRVSLAISCFLVGYYFLLRSRIWLAAFYFLINGFIHSQAFLAPLVLVAGRLKLPEIRLAIVLILPILLLPLNIYPNDSLMHYILSKPWGESLLHRMLGGDIDYLGLKLKGFYDDFRIVPVVVPPTIVLSVWLLPGLSKISNVLYQYVGASLLIGVWLLWLYALVPDVQLRFWHFFMVPMVFLIGNINLTKWRLVGIVFISLVYCLKYTIVNDLLRDQYNVKVENTVGGSILTSSGYPDGPGFPCGDQCGVRYPQGFRVNFTAKADEGFRFDRWVSGCAGKAPICLLDIDSDQIVRGIFVAVEPISLLPLGKGRVWARWSGTGILCQPRCDYPIDKGTAVEIKAEPFSGSRWLEWTGSCQGQPNPCHLTMDATHKVGARFVDVHKVTVIPAEGGHVVWEGADRKSCPGACEKTVDAGSQVRFKAQPEAGYRFDRWALGCSDKLPDCEITVDSTIEVSARFVPVTEGGAD